MTISIFDLFSIGIGPSSSHTIGPMRAANLFIQELKNCNKLNQVTNVVVDLYGSLALTGIGHCTDFAIVLGLESNMPENIDPSHSQIRYQEILETKKLNFAQSSILDFDYNKNLIFHYQQVLPHHSNGLCFTAFNHDTVLLSKVYYSVGGGFVVDEESYNGKLSAAVTVNENHAPVTQPYPFTTAEELLNHCQAQNKSIAQILLANELIYRSEEEINAGILKIWHVMDESIKRGMDTAGILPGGLNIKRRAPELSKKLRVIESKNNLINNDMNWLSLYAISVNEENAAGGKVVTAPTNGAAGTIPAVLKFYCVNSEAKPEKIIEFLLTAAAIGILYKERASISAAEVGCQGEVGVACSMAAAAYAAVLGGTIYQVENAAEIGMEHNLGMTCDPIGGLVQIPCIERNAAGAVQAINAAQLALLGDGKHYVSLDKVIATMRDTGRDMMSKYKETSLGGLAVNAVNLPEC